MVVTYIARAVCSPFVRQAYSVLNSFDKCSFKMVSDPFTSPARDLANTTFDDESCQEDCSSEHATELAAESDPPEDYDELCELCGSLNIECLVLDHKWPGKLYDLSMVIHSASNCRMCARLFGLERLRDLDGAKYNNSVRVSFETHPRVGGSCGALLVYAEYPDGLIGTALEYTAECTAFTNEGEIASSEYGLVPLHIVGSNTSSAESFNIARKWLNDCVEGHQGSHGLREASFRNRFGQSTIEAGVGPARLIDIFAHECVESTGSRSKTHHSLSGDEWKGSSRIVDRADILDPYLALSYKWGSHPSQDHVTTNANLLARKLDLREDKLPKTFRHAINIARRLGVRYLWIDAICIIQDSEFEENWLRESG